MGRLDGKVAIITGAGSGQGATEATLFAIEGAKVVATDIELETVSEVVEEIRRSGGDAIAIKHDVLSEEDWNQVINEALETYGKLNILVNNAGILINKNAEETTLEEWDRVMDVNARGTFLGIRRVIPEMRRAGGGSIVNISSIYGILGYGTAPYNASKGAVRSLTKNVAADFAKDNIRANSVHPGIIATPMARDAFEDPERKAAVEAMTPLSRFGEPKDIAYGVLYLASDESSYMTGAELVLDGGITACKDC